MSQIIHVISKEGLSVDFTTEVASTSTYLKTVMKEDPSKTEIMTNLSYDTLVIANKFCKHCISQLSVQ